MSQRLRFMPLAWLMLSVSGNAVWGQTIDEPSRSDPIERAAQSATVHWENVPLGDALARLGDVFGEAILVDRRVDRSERIRLSAEEATLKEILQRVAADQALGIRGVGGVTYIGPAQAAEKLHARSMALHREVSRLPHEVRVGLDEISKLNWSRLSSPRTLVTNAVNDRGWQVRDETKIPHDLWDGAQLPALTLTDQLSLLLIGFDLSFRILADERVIEIVPLKDVADSQSPNLAFGTSSREPLMEQRLPASGGASSLGERPQEEQSKKRNGLAEMLGGAPGEVDSRRGKLKTRQVYTLRVEEQPVELVLRGLAQKLGWQLEIDETAIRAAGRTLDKRVSFTVKNVDADELLEALLNPAGMTFEMEGQRVLILPQRE